MESSLSKVCITILEKKPKSNFRRVKFSIYFFCCENYFCEDEYETPPFSLSHSDEEYLREATFAIRLKYAI